MENIQAIRHTASVLAPTLGPCGMDSLLVDNNGSIMVTNDGATILGHLPIVHPANKILRNLAHNQDLNVGDGTTSTVLLASSLLQQSLSLLSKNIHPTTIIQEYKYLLEVVTKRMQEKAVKIEDKNRFQILEKVAQTAINSKVLGRYRQFFALLAVNAVLSLSSPQFHKIKIETRTGDTMKSSRLLVSGSKIVARNIPSLLCSLRHITEEKILVTRVDLNKGQTTSLVLGTSVSTMPAANFSNWVSESTEQERKRLSDICQVICTLGVKVVVALHPISPISERLLTEKGIVPIAVSSVDQLDQIALCTGCTVSSSLFDDSVKVGKFKSVDIVRANDSYSDDIYIEGYGNEMCTVELVAPTDGLVAECERSFVDMVRTLITLNQQPLVVGGGGSMHIALAAECLQLPSTSPIGKLCAEAFGEGMLVIPITIASNAGLDALPLILQARDQHLISLSSPSSSSLSSPSSSSFASPGWIAVDLDSSQLEDMFELGVIEPMAVLREGLRSALEVVELILKTDKNVYSRPRDEIL